MDISCRAVGPVAQWLEPAAHNGLVGGSSPPGPTNIYQSLTASLRAKFSFRPTIRPMKRAFDHSRGRVLPASSDPGGGARTFAQSFPAHSKKTCCFPNGDTFLHEPSRSAMP